MVVSHGISAFGDLKYAADFRHFDYVEPLAVKGGTLSLLGNAASHTFDSLNKFILAGEPAKGLGLVYDSLLVRANDEPDAVYGLLAERIEYPKDRSWVIFTLRENARFSDGTPLSASDVVFTFDMLKVAGSPQYRNRLKDVDSVSALSDREIRVSFGSTGRERDLIAEIGQIEILPAHYYDATTFDRV